VSIPLKTKAQSSTGDHRARKGAKSTLGQGLVHASLEQVPEKVGFAMAEDIQSVKTRSNSSALRTLWTGSFDANERNVKTEPTILVEFKSVGLEQRQCCSAASCSSFSMWRSTFRRIYHGIFLKGGSSRDQKVKAIIILIFDGLDTVTAFVESLSSNRLPCLPCIIKVCRQCLRYASTSSSLQLRS
jgi:hypothetical protein